MAKIAAQAVCAEDDHTNRELVFCGCSRLPMLNALKANYITLLGKVRGRGMRHEAPAPIDQKAQPAAPGRSL